MRGIQSALLLREEFADRTVFENGLSDLWLRERALHRSGADKSTWHRIDFHSEVRRLAQSTRELARNNRAQFHNGVVSLSLHTTGANDQAGLVERQLRCIEEEHLPGLSVEWIDSKCGRATASLDDRNREL